jgi:S-formylglutathione hydrolase FrmB
MSSERLRPDPRRRRPDRRAARRRQLVAVVVFAVLAVAVILIARAVFGGADQHGARVLRYSIKSPLTHQTLGQVAVEPPGGGEGRPLLVFLHGKGGNQESNLVSQMFAALAALGRRAPDVVFPYGGEDSYWHDRKDGAWGRYVIDEVIPQAIRRLHADPHRVAIGGISMGGFGAYDLARLHPGAFCAVGADSAALWREGGETAPGSFDDGEDFSRHDVIAAARSGEGWNGATPLWLDVGASDPFRSADTEFVQALGDHGHTVSFHVWPGAHDSAYWDSHWGQYLRFYADALAACR